VGGGGVARARSRVVGVRAVVTVVATVVDDELRRHGQRAVA
jgi:hypothetical protein